MEKRKKIQKKNKDILTQIKSDTPLILDDFEGIMWMRGTCGSSPCKGHYQ